MIKEGEVQMRIFETSGQEPNLTMKDLCQTILSNIEKYYDEFDVNEIRIEKHADLFSLNMTHYNFSTSFSHL